MRDSGNLVHLSKSSLMVCSSGVKLSFNMSFRLDDIWIPRYLIDCAVHLKGKSPTSASQSILVRGRISDLN